MNFQKIIATIILSSLTTNVFAANVPQVVLSKEQISSAATDVKNSEAYGFISKEIHMAGLQTLKLDLIAAKGVNNLIDIAIPSENGREFLKTGLLVVNLSAEASIGIGLIGKTFGVVRNSIRNGEGGFYGQANTRTKVLNIVENDEDKFTKLFEKDIKPVALPKATVVGLNRMGWSLVKGTAGIAVVGGILYLVHESRSALLLTQSQYDLLMMELDSKINNLQAEIDATK